MIALYRSFDDVVRLSVITSFSCANAVIAQYALGYKYGNPDGESPIESAAGNVVGTFVNMIEMHRNLNIWGRLSGVQTIDAAYLWNAVSGEGIPS